MGSFAYGYRGQFSNSSRLSTPTHVPYPEYGLRALFSPGTIGQERGLTPRRYNNQQQQRGQGKMVSRQHRDQGHHNVVSVHRIQNGADVRTTVGRSLTSFKSR